jgi:23S rRNA (guanosine2251-2'-O)-methyltransferase
MPEKPAHHRAPKGRSSSHKWGDKPKRADSRIWLYGRHAVAAALQNPARKIRRLAATKNAHDWLCETLPGDLFHRLEIEDLRPDAIDKILPAGSVHQGIALFTDPLERARLRDVCKVDAPGPVIILDQITDTQNIGAIFRNGAAFGAQAVIFQDRRTPPLSGALAKAAVGALDIVPAVSVVNIARALEALNEMGFRTVGLAGETDQTLADIPRDRPIALVMGAEGAGLRKLVRETCSEIARIPISETMESLNVSSATAISLYEITRGEL